jgi:hypothetical protein
MAHRIGQQLCSATTTTTQFLISSLRKHTSAAEAPGCPGARQFPPNHPAGVPELGGPRVLAR